MDVRGKAPREGHKGDGLREGRVKFQIVRKKGLSFD